jgi:hypothetical protein
MILRALLFIGSSLLALGGLGGPAAAQPTYGWLTGAAPGGTLAERTAPPPGFRRLPAPAGSFGVWLRGLPLFPGRPSVHLYDGRLKGNQEAHVAVVRIDVGARDLQQCADAVMRLRAEYLWSRGCAADIDFRLTSGDRAAWTDWRSGMRPRVRGNRVEWRPGERSDGSYASFRRYLDAVYNWAGSASLEKQLNRVTDPSRVEIGDVVIHGGFPGHAVLVVDVAEGPRGERAFLLAQSYMPAQEIQILRNPETPGSPWYRAAASGPLPTPEWPFRHEELRRFPAPRSCATARP